MGIGDNMFKFGQLEVVFKFLQSFLIIIPYEFNILPPLGYLLSLPNSLARSLTCWWSCSENKELQSRSTLRSDRLHSAGRSRSLLRNVKLVGRARGRIRTWNGYIHISVVLALCVVLMTLWSPPSSNRIIAAVFNKVASPVSGSAKNRQTEI